MFTTLGRFVLGAMDEDSYGLTDEQRESIRQSYSNSGFGYSDYELLKQGGTRIASLPSRYGIAVATPAWVCATLRRETPKLDLLAYQEGGYGLRWGRPVRPANGICMQDFVTCIRVRDDQV